MTAIEEARKKAGLSRAAMSRQFEIPVRTIENWEAGINQPPAWAEKLIIEKLESMKTTAAIGNNASDNRRIYEQKT